MKTNYRNFFRLAAPSFVWPEPVTPNCQKLAGVVDEAAILFFETQSCLGYTKNEFGPELLNLDLSYHIHLPLDLKWGQGGYPAISDLEKLIKKTLFLNPTGFVLHPPRKSEHLLGAIRVFDSLDIPREKIFLENTEECDLATHWKTIENMELSVCLDIGHFLAYSQNKLMKINGLLEKVRMVHAYCPDEKGRHMGLEKLDLEAIKWLKKILISINPGFCLVLEVFNPTDLKTSMATLDAMFSD